MTDKLSMSDIVSVLETKEEKLHLFKNNWIRSGGLRCSILYIVMFLEKGEKGVVGVGKG